MGCTDRDYSPEELARMDRLNRARAIVRNLHKLSAGLFTVEEFALITQINRSAYKDDFYDHEFVVIEDLGARLL
jgi:hypothetical protein